MHSKEVGIPFLIESKLKSKYEILESNVLKTLEQKRNKLPLKIEDKLWIYNGNLINRVTFAKKTHDRLAHTTNLITIGGRWGTEGFNSIAPLIYTIVSSFLHNGKHHLLKSHAPEILYLFPKFRSESPFVNAQNLEDIALPPSRRRLHKESEQMFRVTQAIVKLLLEYTKHLNHTNTIILFDQIDRMDEHSLRCFARLSKCIEHHPIVIVATVSEASERDSRFHMASHNDICMHVNLAENRNKLLESLYHQIKPSIYELTDLKDENQSDCSYENSLTMQPVNNETHKSAQLLDSITNGDVDHLDELLLEALEISVFTQNYEHALFLINKASPYIHNLRKETHVELWIYMGLCYAFMVEYDKALAIFKNALSLTEDTLKKSELHLYVALLCTKRLNKPLVGREIIDQALQSIEGTTGSEVEVERTWLHNLRALTFVGTGDLAQAFKECKQGLEHIKEGNRKEDAIHIKINLISNISVLFESMKKVDAALKHWSKFEPFVTHSSPVFTKHYLYRKAGLLFKLQRYAEAIESLEDSYRIAKEMNDAFHMDIIARSIGAIYFEQEIYDKATQWYSQSLDSKLALMQDEDLPRVATALAICLERQGNGEAGKQEILNSLKVQSQGSAAQKASEIVLKWDQKRDETWESYVKWSIQKPETKLNRPFDLTNLYYEKAERIRVG
nr:tetratricopeptide repeat protein [Paenibacillus xylanexedens]